MGQSAKKNFEFTDIKLFLLVLTFLLSTKQTHSQVPIINGQTSVQNESSYIYSIANINEITNNGTNEIVSYWWSISGGEVRKVENDAYGNPIIINDPVGDYTDNYSWAEGDPDPQILGYDRIGVKWLEVDIYNSYVWYGIDNGWDYYNNVLYVNAGTSSNSKMTFEYDLAGNQTRRELCLSGCTSKKTKSSKVEIKDIESITDEDLQKFYPGDEFSYYPNPVKEELYLKWQQPVDNYVSSIKIYELNGQLFKNYSVTKDSNTQNISFQNLPVGIYMVAIVYSNGEQKTIKIIKNE